MDFSYFECSSTWKFEFYSWQKSLNVSIIASKRYLKVKTVEGKCSAERFGKWNEQQVCFKYGIPKNTFYISKNWKGRRFCQIWKKSCTNPKRKKMRTGGYEDIDKAKFQWFLAKRSQNVPTDGDLLKDRPWILPSS